MSILLKRLLILALFFLVSISSVSAAAASDAPNYSDPVFYIKISAYFILALSLFVTTIGKKVALTYKKLFFLLFLIPAVLSSLYLAGHTVHGNIVSDTKGPVHWHADYEIWVCGEKLDLIDPKGLRNKIGTPLFHEHNDDRIHVEGTVMHLEDVDLGSYFYVIGGQLTSTSLVFPTNDGVITVKNGDTCSDGSVGELAVYVNGERKKDPANYIIAPEIFVPDGDCFIVEFGPNPGETTERICLSWESEGVTYESHRAKMEVRNNG